MELDLSSVGLVLSGGGFKCVAQVGWLEDLLPPLMKAGAKVTYIAGTSGGGLNGGKLAEAQTTDELLNRWESLAKIWEDVENAGPQSVFPLSLINVIKSIHKESLLDGQTLDNLLNGGKESKTGERSAKSFNPRRVLSSPRRFDVFVTNARTGAHEIISNRDRRVQENPQILTSALKATASIPPFFPNVEIEGVPYMDGGHIQLGPAIKAGCKTIFVLLPYRQDGYEGRPTDFISRLFPWIPRIFALHSAQARELDRIEIIRAKKIAANLEIYRKLHDAMRSLFWRSSKKSFLDHLMLEKIDALFEGASFSFKDKHSIQIIDVAIERQPGSLLMYTFKRGDLSRLRENCRNQMRRIRQTIGLGD